MLQELKVFVTFKIKTNLSLIKFWLRNANSMDLKEKADLFIYLLCLGIELELINLKIRENNNNKNVISVKRSISLLNKNNQIGLTITKD